MKFFQHSKYLSFTIFTLLVTPLAAYAENVKQEVLDSCIEVEVDGQRILPTKCLGKMMEPKPQKHPAEHTSSFDSSSAVKRQPNEIGQFSQSALRNRMGTNLGKSAKPQRPPR